MQVQSDDRPAALTQCAQVTEGLGELQPAQGERLAGHLYITLYGPGDLQEHAIARAAFMILAGRVQEPGSPAESHRVRGPGGQRIAQPGGARVTHPVQVGHDRQVAPRRR